MHRILVVEDDGVIGLFLEKRLEGLGYEVAGVLDNGREAIDFVENNEVDLVLMDINLPGGLDGIETAEYLYQTYHLPVIYLSAYSDGEILERAKRTMVYGYLLKPVEEKALKIQIEMALNKHRLETRLKTNGHDHSPQNGHAMDETMMKGLKKVAVGSEDEVLLLDPSTIIFAEVRLSKVYFHTKDQAYEQRGTLQQWGERLKPYGFFRCHKSYLVNVGKIKGMTRDVDHTLILVMEDHPILIPVARDKVVTLKKMLNV